MIDIEQVPPERPMPSQRRHALREVLMAEVRRSRPWWRRSRQAATVGAGAIALVLAGGAATAYVAFQPTTDDYSVVCYSAPRMDGDVASARVGVGRAEATDSPNASGQAATVDDPIETCAQLWQQGMLRENAKELGETGPPVSRTEVPQLVSCTLEDGMAGVFPGDADTCRSLDLPQTAGTQPK